MSIDLYAPVNHKSGPPERIYNWLDGNLSIARYYCGCNYKAASYLIDMQDPDRPLVRQDIYMAQQKAAKAEDTAKRKSEIGKRLQADKAQQELL